MTAEDFLVNDGGDGQTVEAVGERFPQLDVESSFTLNTNERTEQPSASTAVSRVVKPQGRWRTTYIRHRSRRYGLY